MKSIRFIGSVVLAFFLGSALGIYLSQPPRVRAQGSIYVHVQKVREGLNPQAMGSGREIVGFACTQQDCYIATH